MSARKERHHSLCFSYNEPVTRKVVPGDTAKELSFVNEFIAKKNYSVAHLGMQRTKPFELHTIE